MSLYEEGISIFLGHGIQTWIVYTKAKIAILLLNEHNQASPGTLTQLYLILFKEMVYLLLNCVSFSKGFTEPRSAWEVRLRCQYGV